MNSIEIGAFKVILSKHFYNDTENVFPLHGKKLVWRRKLY